MNFTALASQIVRSMEYFFHAHLLIALLTYVVVAVLLRKHLRHLSYRSVSHEKVPFEQFYAPKISIIIPANNEAEGIIESVNAALSTDYPHFNSIHALFVATQSLVTQSQLTATNHKHIQVYW
jgi:cellulose synthase/poly-beta-1,6-N-acetylglucosamine synthase-like glycosyltransferase